MLRSVHIWRARGAEDATEAYLEMVLSSRDSRRDFARASVSRSVRRVLETVAFRMQAHANSRTYTTEANLCQATVGHLYSPHAEQVDDLIEVLVRGTGILVEAGETSEGRIFAFAHTAFREHLAAVYIARQNIAWLSTELIRLPCDASSQAVIRTALRWVARRHEHSELERLVRQWRRVEAEELAVLAEDVFWRRS